ncbi:MAG: DNA-processing protein DprA [Burkholderiales bacterium]
MPADAELKAWLALGLTAQLTPSPFRKLLHALGGPEEILKASADTLAQFVADTTVQAIRKGPDPLRLEQSLRWLEDPTNRIVSLADEHYPKLLLEISDPPVILYVKGDVALLNRPTLAIVGSRNPTHQGVANSVAFGREISDAGLTIVSGLALGIDAAAHKGGLAGKSSSIAVMGTGLDIVYPARNRELAHELALRGAIVSEFPLATPAVATNFPRRNRVISGFSRGCLVVEANVQSGSLITARCAIEQGREVFAIPGSIHSPQSRGCHLLIKQGAKLVETSLDILEELGLQSSGTPTVATIATDNPLHRNLLESLGYDPVDLDALCFRAGLAPENASAMLLELELNGSVKRLPGGKFQRVL